MHRNETHSSLLRVVGGLTCVVAGSPVWVDLIRRPELLGRPRFQLWCLLFAMVLGSFALMTSKWCDRRGRWFQRLLLVGMTGSALAASATVPNSLHGVLLVIAAAVAAEILPLPAALLWLAGQTAIFGWISQGSYSPVETLTLVGAFGGFQLFALYSALTADRERTGREELARAHGELLATRRLLEDTTRSAERLRISRELHDVMGHRLTALTLNLEAARHSEGDAAQLQIDKAEIQARQLLSDVRRVVSALREEPAVDLARALEALGAGIDRPAIHREVPEALQFDDPEPAHALLRSAQEGLTNALRHGRAANVWLTVERADGGVALTVRDDGRGAAAPKAADRRRAGHGLAGLRERLEPLGGRLTTESPPGGGFTLRAWLPVGL
ncbi:MAG: sensor histidine kinase [Acidobacteriota bacterium]